MSCSVCGSEAAEPYCQACGYPLAGLEDLDAERLLAGARDDPGQADVYAFWRETRALALAMFAAAALCAALAAAVMAGPGGGERVAVALALAALAAFALVYGAGQWRAGVSLHEGGIRVRNPFRTYDLAWPDVSHFGVGLHQGFGRPAAGALLHLANGRTLEPRALRRSGMVWNLTRHREAVAAHVAALNRRLNALRPGPAPE